MAALTATPIDTDEVEEEGTPPGRSFGVGVLVLAVVVSLLAGFAVAAVVLMPRQQPSPDDSSPEAGFARDMITHHDQAVAMGMIAFRNAAHPEVRQLAYDIAMTQQGEIGMMHQWLREWGLSPTGAQPRMAWMSGSGMDMSPGPDGLMPGMASPDELTALRGAEGTEVDRLFLELMTAHHVGGLHMVEAVLPLTDDDQVSWLAGVMRNGQQKEMRTMSELQAQLGL